MIWRKIVVISLALMLAPLALLDVYAQHHGNDPPTASVGDRRLTTLLNIEAIDGGTEYTGHLKLIDDDTDKAIPHVTFFLTISKDSTSLFKEWFHDHEGNLPFTIRPKDTEKITVFCDREPTLNGCMKTGGNTVLIEGPLFMTAGDYLFRIEVFSIDNDKTLLKDPIKFDIVMPIGYKEEPKNPVDHEEHQANNNGITVAMKLTKKSTLLAIKNAGDMQVHSVKIKTDNGSIRFVKAKGWEREKIDASTVMIKTEDKPLSAGKSLFVILVVDKRGTGIEWTAFGANASVLSSGALIP